MQSIIYHPWDGMEKMTGEKNKDASDMPSINLTWHCLCLREARALNTQFAPLDVFMSSQNSPIVLEGTNAGKLCKHISFAKHWPSADALGIIKLVL